MDFDATHVKVHHGDYREPAAATVEKGWGLLCDLASPWSREALSLMMSPHGDSGPLIGTCLASK